MNSYLEVRTGPYRLLLNSAGVHEVLALEGVPAGAQGHYEWRAQAVLAVNVGRVLSGNDIPGGVGVAYSPAEGETPVMLELEEVMRLRHVHDREWKPLPRVPRATRDFFDAVITDADSSTQVYRLLRPLPTEAILDRMDPVNAVAHVHAAASAPAATGKPVRKRRKARAKE